MEKLYSEIEINDTVQFLGYVEPKWSDETLEKLLSRGHWIDVYKFNGKFTRCPYKVYYPRIIKGMQFTDSNSQIVLN